jgi:predicted trehalose synthase
MAESMGQLQERNQTNKQRMMEQIQSYRDKQYDRTRNEKNDAFDQKYKNASLAQKGNDDKEQIAKWGKDPVTGEKIYTYNEIDPLSGKKIMYDSEGQPFTN